MAAGETSAGNLRLVLTAGLLILPFWAWNTSDPWLSLWRESWQLIDSLGLWNAVERGNDLLGLSFTAILATLFLPFLELGTATSFLLTSLIVLLVLWAGKRHPALTLAQCLGVQLAFLLSSFFAVDAFQNLNPLLQQGLSRVEPEAIKVSAWLLRQEELAILGARQLMWHCVGYLLLTLVALSVEGRRRVRRIASSESMGEIHSSAPLPMTFHEPALRENSEALLARPVSVSAPKEGEADGELGYSSYLLKPRSGLPWSLLPGRHAYAISGPAYDTSERVLWYTEATEGSIRLVRTSGEATVAIRPIGIPLRTLYEVREPHNRQLIGSLKRGDLSGAEWQWVNYEGRQVGSLTHVALNPGFAKYALGLEGQTVCTFLWCLNNLRPQLEIDFSEDLSRKLDRRVGLALGVVIEPMARFRAHLFSQ
jgi:hypothetical protein